MLEQWAQNAVRRQAGTVPRPHHGARLLLAILLLLAVLSLGCAARLVTVGQTYYVVWPNAKPDIVEIHRDKGDGWVQCRSITDNVLWTCNLNAALYLVHVTYTPPTPQPEGQRTD